MAPPSGSLALAGAGWAANVHALAAAALGVPLTAVASRRPERATALAGRYGALACRYEELPLGASTVVVATPPPRHRGDTVSALASGASVIVEKPLCATLRDADAMVAADPGGRIAYAENLLYAPAVRLMLDRMGDLGPVHHLSARTLSPLPSWGEFTTPGWGGGVLFDLGIHALALVLWLAAPARVVAVEARLEGAGSHPVDEHADVTVEFDSGLRAGVTASWRSGPTPAWSVQAASATGVLRAELLPDPSLEHNGAAVALPRATAPIAVLDQLGYTGQLSAFLHAFASATAPVPGVGDGRLLLEVVCAAYASAALFGAPVAMPFTGARDRTPLELWHPG